ncbi:MAG: hypothetical protein HDR52_09150 [Treponema sp.]|nr:hypothetical protein [Treponema sp.]
MTKRNILTVILDSIFIIVFNALFFLYDCAHSVSTIWICYGFLHFAYLMILIIPLIESKGKTASHSHLTTYLISFLYFIATFAFAMFVFFNRNSIGKIKLNVMSIVSVEIITTMLYIVILVINILMNDTIAKKQAKHDAEKSFIKAISAKTKYIESLTAGQILKSRLEDLYVTAYTSPIHTSNEVAVYEEKIMNLLAELEKNIEQNKTEKSSDLITEINRLLNKRNLIVKARQM